MASDTRERVRQWSARTLRSGLPFALVALLAIASVIALLIAANDRTTSKPLAYAEFSATPNGCVIEGTRAFNAQGCTVVGPGTYSLTFVPSLRHTTPVVSVANCCIRRVGASVSGDKTVTVAFPRFRRGVARATVVLP
jgi:hypothetical protein